jgi:hypothetical protein
LRIGRIALVSPNRHNFCVQWCTEMNFPLNSKADLQSPRLVQLFDYWTRLRGPRIAPALREIDPREISQLLPWIWLADVVDDGEDFGFRLGGERIIEYVGRRLSGARLNFFRGQPFFETMRDAFKLCVETKAPVVRGPTRSTLEARNYQDMQVLLLPLSANGETITQLFGGMTLLTMDERKSA